ncbi:MAG: T9SS type A sorting domain-containing protein, partial [Prolixibacteraceae bacterium]|nr:T9SS type A sorting domain-containing protein [Prolixibacteraceae bacterium]
FRNPSAGTELINIRFFVSAPEEIVSLKVFDLKGALLWHEENQYANTGTQTVQWDGKNSGGTPTGKGVYFMKIMNGSNVSLIKIMRE